jgi:hypothetical protein
MHLAGVFVAFLAIKNIAKINIYCKLKKNL